MSFCKYIEVILRNSFILEIQKHLPEELKRKDWDILIAHFLGVDHCGHKYGPLHAEMGRKLSEMNEVIDKVIKNMDDDTMLIVMGDHGMTITGDHGGGSEDETEALLFAYSKRLSFVPTLYDKDSKVMQQIDLAPTLSVIMGVPVPYSNLGKIIFQLLPDVQVGNLKRHQLMLFHLWQNAKQIKNYFGKYTENNEKTFSYDDLDELEQKFTIFEHRVNSLYTDEAFNNFAKDVRQHLSNVLELCRNVWIKFNPNLMSQGLLVAFMGVFIAFILIYNLPLNEFNKTFNKKILGFAAGTSIPVAGIAYFLYKEFGMDDEILSMLFYTSIYNVLIMAYIIVQNWELISENMNKIKEFASIFARCSFVFTIMVFFSNSFIVNEQRILSYLLMAQVLHVLYDLKTSTKVAEFKSKFKLGVFLKSVYFKIIVTCAACIILLRISHKYFKCREEQGDCWDFLSNSEAASNTKKQMEIIPIIVVAAFVTVARILLKTSGNLTGYSLNVILTRFAPTVSVICASGHFALSQNLIKKTIIPQVHLDTLAWVAYGVLIAEIIVIIVNPLLIHILPRSMDQISVSNKTNVIPELFKHVKNIFNEGNRNKSGGNRIPIIYGLSTVYSSVFVAFSVVFGIVLAMLVGVKVSNGLMIVIAVSYGILFISSVLRYESTDNLMECLQPRFSTVACWFLLINYGFYATSHQPTISQIDWNAAFVGRSANSDISHGISGLLVLLSTFNANFLLLSIYPMIILFPFMIYAIYPKLSLKVFQMDKKSKEEKTADYRNITLTQNDDENEESKDLTKIDFDVTRGEINLFENEKLFIASAFKVGCQLIILQGVKILAAMLACTILCRHLMVWKIFAPRFIYEGIASYVSFFAIVIGFLFLLRVHYSVNKLVDKINKKS